jgi:hypothetical protein
VASGIGAIDLSPIGAIDVKGPEKVVVGIFEFLISILLMMMSNQSMVGFDW